MRTLPVLLLLAFTALSGAGCNYERTGAVGLHYNEFKAQKPRKNSVTVCSAYGCQKQTKFSFTRGDRAKIASLMRRIKKGNTPHQERRAVAYAVAWMERRVGKAVGTDKDRAGMDYNGSGDPTQQDCVDEATNTTSYLLYLNGQGLIKRHTVEIPFAKGEIWKGVKYWPHWTAVLKEKKTGQKFAVDTWLFENGENPAIVEIEKWYIEDNSSEAARKHQAT